MVFVEVDVEVEVEVDVEVDINDVNEGSLLNVAVESLWLKIVDEVFDEYSK
jgi:hypothetical protein